MALFVIVPIVELALLIWVGGQIGVWPTILIILATAIVGAWMAQQEGLAVWRRFQDRLASGQMPGKELTDGLIILFSAALLLTPGVLTDLVGFLGLFPVTRAGIRGFLGRRMRNSIEKGTVNFYTFGASRPPPRHEPPPRKNDDIIDVPFEEIDRSRKER